MNKKWCVIVASALLFGAVLCHAEEAPLDSTAATNAAASTATNVDTNVAVNAATQEPTAPELVALDTLANSADTVAPNPYGLPDDLMPLWKSLSIKQKAAQMVMVYMTPADFMLKNEFGGYLVMKNHLKI